MTQLEYLMDALFECGPNDANVTAFTEAQMIIGGHDAVEEFLVCDIWLLSENCEFEVERRESPILKVVVPMPKVTPIIVKQESEAALEARIEPASWQLLREHNSCMGLWHGRFNRVFELAGVHYQPCPEPITRTMKK
jgi:hypothetical protein